MKKFLNFSGRASRSEFWSFMFFNILILILLSYSRNFLNTLSENLFFLSGRLGNFIYYLYFYDSLLVALSSGSRRMHDVGKTGFYILYPVYGLLLATTEGHRGSNDYGSNPLGGLELVEEIDWDSYSNGVKNGDL
ncbi:MAG: DUF805 domain-containing protein [Candidatus Cloacimonetes bacterium]|nr:DUF805 domain-containing protein [Candidatus Cloacimonadota bacterium]